MTFLGTFLILCDFYSVDQEFEMTRNLNSERYAGTPGQKGIVKYIDSWIEFHENDLIEYRYIQMEYYPGGTLQDWLKKDTEERSSKLQQLRFMQQIAQTVAFLHDDESDKQRADRIFRLL